MSNEFYTSTNTLKHRIFFLNQCAVDINTFDIVAYITLKKFIMKKKTKLKLNKFQYVWHIKFNVKRILTTFTTIRLQYYQNSLLFGFVCITKTCLVSPKNILNVFLVGCTLYTYLNFISHRR